MRHPLAAVLFDLDGTLLDSRDAWRSGLAQVATAYSMPLTDALHARTIGLSAKHALRILFEEGGLDLDAAEFARALALLEERATESLVGGPVWFPGAIRLIHDLRRHSVPTGLVTSSSSALVHRLLELTDVPPFDVVICGDDVSCSKPAPVPYAEAARRLGVLPKATVAVEDSAVGILSARRAGCVVLAVGAELDPLGAARWVRTISEVSLDLLRALVPAHAQDGEETTFHANRY